MDTKITEVKSAGYRKFSTERLTHPFAPVVSENSKILILGSFPSVKSREEGFYYGHPRNRFWRMLADIFGCGVPATVEEKRKLVISHGLALWDTLACCNIHASSDASIREEEPNDIPGFVQMYPVKKVLFNGKASYKYYEKYYKNNIIMKNIEKVIMPSTSPANAAASLGMLEKIWGEALGVCGVNNENSWIDCGV